MDIKQRIIELNEEINRIQRIRDQIKRMMQKIRIKYSSKNKESQNGYKGRKRKLRNPNDRIAQRIY